MAAFEGGAASFGISGASTLTDLASHLAYLGEQHGEALTAVRITLTVGWTIDPSGTGADLDSGSTP
jgi:hypothetical protein